MSDMVRQWKITGPLANLTADRYTREQGSVCFCMAAALLSRYHSAAVYNTPPLTQSYFEPGL